MTTRGVGSNHMKGKRDFGKFKTNDREDLKNQCAFCRGHWKIDCLKLKLKKKESKLESNIA